MANDYDILKTALARESDSRDNRPENLRNWQAYQVGAGRADINRLLEGGYIQKVASSSRVGPNDFGPALYRLTEKGRKLVFAARMEHEFKKVSRDEVLEAMGLVVGFDDLKLELAKTISRGKRNHYLFEGPPACAKSVMLEAIRSILPEAYMAFGSRTSASGLSDVLFDRQPSYLLLDEADKMRGDVFSVLLGLMEHGEILETKNQKTRGLQIQTTVIAACNSSQKMTKEFKSRFHMHVHFDAYTREEFLDVVIGMLSRGKECPEDLARSIGEMTYDNGLGDVRQARAIWDMMDEPTIEEAMRISLLKQKYGPNKKRGGLQIPGL